MNDLYLKLREEDKFLNNLFGKNSNSGLGITDNQQEILRYNGGPGSILGVGQTTIKRATNTQLYDNEEFKKEFKLLNYSGITLAADSKKDSSKIKVFITIFFTLLK